MTEPFILCSVAGTTYGLRSRDVAHIEMVEHVTGVPNAPPAVDGVVFSRGEVVPALNLRVRFGFERRDYDVRTRLLVVRSGGRTVGLLVDDAREFMNIASDAIQPPAAALSGLSGEYLEGVVNVADRLILVLKLAAVLELPEPVQVIS